MSTVYVVRTLPVRDAMGAVIGWVRADPFADGTKPTDLVLLRDGSACSQADAAARLAIDPSLLYPTRHDAVREGIAHLRAADATDRRRADVRLDRCLGHRPSISPPKT